MSRPGLIVAGIALAIVAGAGFFLGKGCGERRSAADLAAANQKLATAEETIKIKDGLFAEKLNEIKGLKTILNSKELDITNLREQLAKTKEELLTIQRVAIKWRDLYNELVANQTEEPGEGETVRKRVDFQGELGPFQATGHTLTDPPEAFLNLHQLRPLHLSIAVAQGKDGKWNTYVSTDDPDVEVDVALAGVDPLILRPSWKERIRVDLQALPLGTPAVGYGVSYEFDRWSLGIGCVSSFGDNVGTGCGVNLGLKPFR